MNGTFVHKDFKIQQGRNKKVPQSSKPSEPPHAELMWLPRSPQEAVLNTWGDSVSCVFV